MHALESDLTIQHGGEPIGERIVVTGRVLDGDGRPVRRQLVEIWQANAGGPLHPQARPAPGTARPELHRRRPLPHRRRRRYRFTTIKPGPYPWKNHHNAWRPAHIHFSLFGTDFTQRMVTQMYFPGDPLFALDPIYQSIVDQEARDRLVATYDHDVTTPRVGDRLPLGHRADRHRSRTWIEPRSTMSIADRPDARARPSARSSATRCRIDAATSWSRPARPARSGCTAGCTTAPASPVPDALLEIWQADADGVVPRPGRVAAPRRLDVHRLGPGRDRRRRATTRSPPSTGADRAGRGRRSSRSPSSPAACSTGCSPGPTCPDDEGRWPPTRCWRSLAAGAPRRP